MFIKTKVHEEQLIIYREMWGTLLYVTTLAFASIGFGLFFLNIEEMAMEGKVFGWIFFIAGLLCLASLPRYYKKVREDHGAVLLKADNSGISASPILNMQPIEFDWRLIDKIILCKTLVTLEHRSKGYSWHQMVITFKDNILPRSNIFSVSKQHIYKNSQGDDFTVVPISKNDLQLIAQALTKVSHESIDMAITDRHEIDCRR